MSKIHLKLYNTVFYFLVSVLLFSSCVSFEREHESIVENPVTQESQTKEESVPTNESEPEEITTSKIGSKITATVYESIENGLKTYLRFEGSEDSSGMFGSVTLSSSATSCKYVYTYDINGDKINAKFYGSDCGESSSDQTFIYNENSNSVSCYINGERFVFNSIF